MNDFIDAEKIEAETAALKLELLALQSESEKIKQRISNIDRAIQAAIKKAVEPSSAQTKYLEKSENRPNHNDSAMGTTKVTIGLTNRSTNNKFNK